MIDEQNWYDFGFGLYQGLYREPKNQDVCSGCVEFANNMKNLNLNMERLWLDKAFWERYKQLLKSDPFTIMEKLRLVCQEFWLFYSNID